MQTNKYTVGDPDTAPRGGEPCTVARVGVSGGILATHDGSIPLAGSCSCANPDARYFEYIGGKYSGLHGWFDAACGKVFQVG
jgi:hypothetical protein